MAVALAEDALEALWFGVDDRDAAEHAAEASAAAALAQDIGLKPFPQAAQKALALLRQDDFSFVRVDRIVSEDPGLASRVLKMANSGYYHSVSEIVTLRDALVRLGADDVSKLITAAAIHGMFDDSNEAAARVLQHSQRVAAIANVISRCVTAKDTPNLFLLGLLHDVGKLLLIQAEMWQGPMTDADHGAAGEIDARGFDHAVLGALALQQWNIPEPIPTIVRDHHRSLSMHDDTGVVAQCVAALRLASVLEHVWHDAELTDDQVRAVIEASAEAQVLHLEGPRLDTLWYDMQVAFRDA